MEREAGRTFNVHEPAEIARRLVLAPGTAANHVEAILRRSAVTEC
jgi:DNA-binding NarL/FixJ family response regulator